MKILNSLRKIDLELVIWLTALVMLALTNPTEHHWTLCPLSNLGFKYCPGCGLGRSISYLFRGDISASFHMHPLGIFALGIISYRIIQIINKQYIHKPTIK
ncbi:MAG: DUF2752 domain-containing protein [Bacteroidota bacterium]|nr:DUF2752 domain-containing protein [Bacteroidota bacterium]